MHPKIKTPGTLEEAFAFACVGETDVPHSHAGKYPRLPIRGALERYGSKLHMRPTLCCTQRRGRGASPTGDLNERTSIYVRARYVMIY